MEKLTHIEQLIWGTSLDMATDEEIDICHRYIKDYLGKHNSEYKICDQSEGTKVKRAERRGMSLGPAISSFTETVWLCGESYDSSDLCNEVKSISKDDFELMINSMVPDDIEINIDNIIDRFKEKGFAKCYNCNRIFFINK